MREILFRGKSIYEDYGWVYGDLSFHVQDGIPHVFPSDGYDSPGFYEVVPETVGQYTGLQDKSGTKIFEGDIVRVSKFRTLGKNNVPVFHEPFNLEVLFFSGGFFFSTKNDIEKLFGLPIVEYDVDSKDGDSMVVEVVGNIHDNKELLESGTPLKRRFMQKQ